MSLNLELLEEGAASFRLLAQGGEVSASRVAAQIAAYRISLRAQDGWPSLHVWLALKHEGRPSAISMGKDEDQFLIAVDQELISLLETVIFYVVCSPGVVDRYCQPLPRDQIDLLAAGFDLAFESEAELRALFQKTVVGKDLSARRRMIFVRAASTLAKTFLFLHEAAHVVNGHLDFSEVVAKSIAEPTVDQTRALMARLRRTLEHLADADAFYWTRACAAGVDLKTWHGPGIDSETDALAANVLMLGISLAAIFYMDDRTGRGNLAPLHPDPTSRLYAILRSVTPSCALDEVPRAPISAVTRLGLYTGFRRGMVALRKLDPAFAILGSDVQDSDAPCTVCGSASTSRDANLRTALEDLCDPRLEFEWRNAAAVHSLGTPTGFIRNVFSVPGGVAECRRQSEFFGAWQAFERRY